MKKKKTKQSVGGGEVGTFGDEADLGRLEGVVGRELDVEEEHAALVGRVGRTEDHARPVEHVAVRHRSGADARRRVPVHLPQLHVDSLQGHDDDDVGECWWLVVDW